MSRKYWEELLWSGGGGFYRIATAPFGAAYGALAKARAALYKNGVIKAYRPKALTVSVGNITPGGSGKTPLTLTLANEFIGRNLKTVILTRGYGGKSKSGVVSVTPKSDPKEVGDEPVMMAAAPAVSVIKSPRRADGAKYAEELFKPDVFLLDDGFGHLGIERDFNILLVDTARGFGNLKTMPSGPLREPISELKRADCVVITHATENDAQAAENLKNIIVRHSPNAEILDAAYAVKGVVGNLGESHKPASVLEGKKVVIFSGIGNPKAFRASAEKAGIEVAFGYEFPDHHFYSEKDVGEISRKVGETGAYCALTTEKDMARLGGKKFDCELSALRITLEVERLEWLINRILKRS